MDGTYDLRPPPPAARDGTSSSVRAATQKTMLSRALQKANTAVLLDNATNYEGAIDAYTDACGLLAQVMQRAGADEEKHKLDDIRNTYTTRINELRRLGLALQAGGKALPERPPSGESLSQSILSTHITDGDADDQDIYFIGTATATQILAKSPVPESQNERYIPPRQQSLHPSGDGGTHDTDNTSSTNMNNEHHPSSSYPRSDGLGLSNVANGDLQDLQERGTESTSWLDTIDESGASSSSSIRSANSSLYLRRKQDAHYSRGTEAEFDAALDEAVEAAYDDGLEVVPREDEPDDDIMSHVRRNIELAKQKVREAELEAEAASVSARERDRRRPEISPDDIDVGSGSDLDRKGYSDHEAEEEERILEEMMDDFEFDLSSKSALPRQSGSSGYSSRTWGSSVASSRTNTGTLLSTLTEEDDFSIPPGGMAKNVLSYSQPFQKLPPPVGAPPPPPPPPPHPPVQQHHQHHQHQLPPPPAPTRATPTPPSPSAKATTSSPDSADIMMASTVRSRRLSGRPKELIIETGSAHAPSSADGARQVPLPPSMLLAHPITPLPSKTSHGKSSSDFNLESIQQRPHTAIGSPESPGPDSPAISAFPTLNTHESVDFDTLLTSPPLTLSRLHSAPGISREPTYSAPALGKSSQPPGSPFTTSFIPELGKTFSLPAVPPLSSAGPSRHLFDNNIHSPLTPGSPNPNAPDAPIPLEPCPQSFLLRPFWLMRCLYETITHPRGGYLTTKLFIPRDIWKVKNVRIKGLEEKISNCDLLTAALLKLAKVDTNDADAVLEEMQAFENILDQVQAVWSRKLGNEVGVQGAMALFKLSSDDTSPAVDSSSKPSSSGSKSYLSSWRKLRSKSSGISNTSSSSISRDNGRENLTMTSLPMTDTVATATPRRGVIGLNCTGPNANYMSALARLFDAAQVIDQIARQVEDPGLRHSSQTLVGLELSTRHASEFFGFYACRFALNDIGLMIDKFIKRGSEYVMA
ncbi:MIT microtubule interacting and transport domain protein [Trichophyton interdigitale]|uniref:MIT microtubule interacting and transport domain protein n=1 Tax=Trichophyton interdigitale TaxID=101480 RepID=A0A9P4YEM8_9EURO|nr:MIT microtubule interacting and transport domain protein [Trichophyton interdigitale]KAG5208129.1 MIT microtubule interacting and transport domain protein [Trichophyton interdigitale]KAG8209697.1 MIT microtubule interacting and transport domain protein [Trichophyton interdigitale]